MALACGGDSEEAGSELPAELNVSSELPADFPADVPVYPGAEVVQARYSAAEGSSVSVAFSVKDDPEKVASFYADSLAAEGWSTDIKTTPEGQAIFADKTERRVAANVRKTEKGTQVELIIVEMR
jgi:hypothetical protein